MMHTRAEKIIPEMLYKGISGIFHLIVYSVRFRKCDIITESDFKTVRENEDFLKGGTQCLPEETA